MLPLIVHLGFVMDVIGEFVMDVMGEGERLGLNSIVKSAIAKQAIRKCRTYTQILHQALAIEIAAI